MFEVSISLQQLIARVSGASGPGTARSSIEFGISRVTGSDEREKDPINDLFYVKRRQRLLQYEQLIAYEVERRC